MSGILMPQPRESVAAPQLTRPDWQREAARDPKLLWLDKNENLDPKLQKLTRQLISEIDPQCLSLYPEMGDFYRKLAACESVTPENLLLTAGSDGVIRTVFEAFVREGDVVLHTTPTFAMYPVYCMIFGAKPVALEYLATEKGPQLKVEAVLEKIQAHRPRLLCLPNPDSPTGTVFTIEEMDKIIRTAGETGTLVLIDEAYYPFYPETTAAWIGRYPHLVVARTFSKAWGLAGLRTGYAIAQPELCRILHKVRPMYEVNTVAIAYLDRMLDHQSEMLASVKRINESKQGFNQAMQGLGFKTLNNHGNFTHVAFGELQTSIFTALENLVLYRKDFKDPCLKGYSRFTAATDEVMAPVIDRITTTVLQKRGSP